MYRPACRMSHTGDRSTSSPRRALTRRSASPCADIRTDEAAVDRTGPALRLGSPATTQSLSARTKREPQASISPSDNRISYPVKGAAQAAPLITPPHNPQPILTTHNPQPTTHNPYSQPTTLNPQPTTQLVS